MTVSKSSFHLCIKTETIQALTEDSIVLLEEQGCFVVCYKQTQSWAPKGVCRFFQDSWIKESKCSFKTFPQAQTSVLELNLNLTSVTFSNDWGTGTAACSGVDRSSLNYSRYAVNEQSIMFLCMAWWAACNNQTCCSSNLSLQFDILDKCQKTL